MQSRDFKGSWNTSEGEFGELLLAELSSKVNQVGRHGWTEHLNLSS